MMQMIGMTLMEMNKHSIVDGIEKMLKVDWLMLMKEMLMQDGIMTKNSIYICMEFPLTLGLQKTGLLLIVTSGKLKNLCFLIDTGATHNVLFAYVYEHFKDKFKTLDEKQNIMGIEGHCEEAPTIEATFNFEGIYYTSIFSVLDATDVITQVQQETGVQIHGILSVGFLVKNKWILDFDKLVITTD